MTAKGWKPIQRQFHRRQSPHTSPSTPLRLFLLLCVWGNRQTFPVLEKTEAHCLGSISTVHTPPMLRHGPCTWRAEQCGRGIRGQASQSSSTHVRGFASLVATRHPLGLRPSLLLSPSRDWRSIQNRVKCRSFTGPQGLWGWPRGLYTKRWFSYIPLHTPRGQCVICAVVYIDVHTYVLYTYMFCAVLSCFNRARLFATLWTVAHQAPPSMAFSRQEYWSGFPCPPPKDLSDPGIKHMPPVTPASQADSLLQSHWGNPYTHLHTHTHTHTHMLEVWVVDGITIQVLVPQSCPTPWAVALGPHEL